MNSYKELESILKNAPIGSSLTPTEAMRVARYVWLKQLLHPSNWYGYENPEKAIWSIECSGLLGTCSVGAMSCLGNHAFAANVVYTLGTQEQIEDWSGEIESMSKVYCFALTEARGGTDLKGITTRAILDKINSCLILRSHRLSSSKCYIGNGYSFSNVALVLVNLYMDDGKCEGLHWIRVPLDLQGVFRYECGKKMGADDLETSTIFFNDVCLPLDSLLGRTGYIDRRTLMYKSSFSKEERFKQLIQTFQMERLCISGFATTLLQMGTLLIERRLSNRLQDNKSLMEIPMVAFRWSQWLSIVEGLRTGLKVVHNHLEKLNRNDPRFVWMSALAKTCCGWLSKEGLSELRELGGAFAYYDVNIIPSLYAAADLSTTFGGDNTMLACLAAKTHLKYEGSVFPLSCLSTSSWTRHRVLLAWKIKHSKSENVIPLLINYAWCLWAEICLSGVQEKLLRKILKMKLGPKAGKKVKRVLPDQCIELCKTKRPMSTWRPLLFEWANRIYLGVPEGESLWMEDLEDAS